MFSQFFILVNTSANLLNTTYLPLNFIYFGNNFVCNIIPYAGMFYSFSGICRYLSSPQQRVASQFRLTKNVSKHQLPRKKYHEE